jgi:hypothetical protein
MGLGKEVETHQFLSSHPRPSILLQHLHDTLGLEVSSNGFVRPREDDPIHAIEFFELDWGWWVDGYEADDGRFDLRWGTEIVPRDVDDVVHFCVELYMERRD